MAGLGKHILAEFYGCDFNKLNDLDLLKQAALTAVEQSGATILSHHFQNFNPHGVSGVVIIAESHLSFHTWPEHGYMAIDYFTCGDRIDMQLALDILAQRLQPTHSQRKLHWRGEELAGAPHRPASTSAHEAADPTANRRRGDHLLPLSPAAAGSRVR